MKIEHARVLSGQVHARARHEGIDVAFTHQYPRAEVKGATRWGYENWLFGEFDRTKTDRLFRTHRSMPVKWWHQGEYI